VGALSPAEIILSTTSSGMDALVLGGYYINCNVSLLRFVAGLRNQAKYDKINSDIKQDLRII